MSATLFHVMRPTAMAAYVGFGPEDEARLQALWPRVEPELDAICAEFYRRAMSEEVTSRILGDSATVDRLMHTLKVWARELLNGPWDDAYWERRRRIGHRHVEVGLPPAAMFTAMAVVRQELTRIIFATVPDPAPTLGAVCKITELDVGMMTGSYYDVQREQSLAEFETIIVSNIQSPAVLLDSSDRVTAATPAISTLTGGQSILGRSLLEVLPAELIEASELPRHLEHARSRQRTITLPRVDVRLGDREANFTLTLVPLDHPRADVLVQVEDLTEAVLAEAHLRRQENLAQLGSLAATVAHELRNPLAGISGALQVLSRTMPSDDRRGEIMKKVLEQVHGLDSLVSDLLAFVRPKEPRRELVDLHTVAASVSENARMRFPGVRVELQGGGEAAGDIEMVRQILLNLLINACQAMNGDGSLRVEIRPGTVIVQDSGPGLSPEAKSRLFEPFFTTRTYGTGLGLANSLLLAQSMAGRLQTLDGCELGGACFVMTLPEWSG
jgi:signal transduction histidine kinase